MRCHDGDGFHDFEDATSREGGGDASDNMIG